MFFGRKGRLLRDEVVATAADPLFRSSIFFFAFRFSSDSFLVTRFFRSGWPSVKVGAACGPKFAVGSSFDGGFRLLLPALFETRSNFFSSSCLRSCWPPRSSLSPARRLVANSIFILSKNRLLRVSGRESLAAARPRGGPDRGLRVRRRPPRPASGARVRAGGRPRARA